VTRPRAGRPDRFWVAASLLLNGKPGALSLGGPPADPSPHLLRRLTMSRSKPPLLHMPSWRAQGLYLLLISSRYWETCRQLLSGHHTCVCDIGVAYSHGWSLMHISLPTVASRASCVAFVNIIFYCFILSYFILLIGLFICFILKHSTFFEGKIESTMIYKAEIFALLGCYAE
jgi:hypothetical protein